MEKRVFKTVVYDVETTGELQMSATIAKVSHTDHNGQRPYPDEVCFSISGYDPASDKEIDIIVTISKDETKELAAVLLELAK